MLDDRLKCPTCGNEDQRLFTSVSIVTGTATFVAENGDPVKVKNGNLISFCCFECGHRETVFKEIGNATA